MYQCHSQFLEHGLPFQFAAYTEPMAQLGCRNGVAFLLRFLGHNLNLHEVFVSTLGLRIRSFVVKCGYLELCFCFQAPGECLQGGGRGLLVPAALIYTWQFQWFVERAHPYTLTLVPEHKSPSPALGVVSRSYISHHHPRVKGADFVQSPSLWESGHLSVLCYLSVGTAAPL